MIVLVCAGIEMVCSGKVMFCFVWGQWWPVQNTFPKPFEYHMEYIVGYKTYSIHVKPVPNLSNVACYISCNQTNIFQLQAQDLYITLVLVPVLRQGFVATITTTAPPIPPLCLQPRNYPSRIYQASHPLRHGDLVLFGLWQCTAFCSQDQPR